MNRLLRRLSLRARLVVGVVALAAVALVAADIATYVSLRSFLLNRVDSSLEAGHAQVEQQAVAPFVDGGQHEHGHPGDQSQDFGPPAAGINWYELRTVSGKVLADQFLVGGGSAPKLPAHISLPTAVDRTNPSHERVEYFTVSAKAGSPSYRVRASIDPAQPKYLLIVAGSLHDVSQTSNRLLLIELLVTVVALAGIAGLGVYVVRLGLRPLRAIETTAATIAGGDLSRRVKRADRRTEVGRLGLSLNAMLGQIESAFTARERSEARLRRFVADASHELRTPLAAVRAYAELFGRGAASRPEDLERSMNGIMRETERMSLLVEDLLLLARLDEGRPLERKAIDLSEVINEAADAARVVEPNRPMTVAAEPAPIIGDRARLRQVIDNLLSNVRAHTPPEAAVTITLRRSGEQVELRVTDSGPGLTDTQMARVFERFYRVDSSRTRTQSRGGVGLGLSIVAAVVEAHGGTTGVESAPGQGATFVVTLPLAADAPRPVPQAELRS